MRTQLQRLAALRPTHQPTTNLERTETAAETAPQTSGKRTMKKINKPYRDSIAAIKAAGFSHFKVELEATFNRGNFWETWAHPDYCQRYIMRHLSAETKAAIGFKHFYNDGTVDSELTFTLPIDEAHRAIEVMQVFMSIGQKTGHTNTDRAGMHLTVMTSSVYPTRKRLSAPEAAATSPPRSTSSCPRYLWRRRTRAKRGDYASVCPRCLTTINTALSTLTVAPA
jgi:hypothetical protein